VDPGSASSSISAKQRRALLKAVVRDNVYIKAGRRPPTARPRRWSRWIAVGAVVPCVAAGALLFLPPDARSSATARPATRVASLAAAPSGARSATTSVGAAPAGPQLDPARVLGEPRALDSAVFPVGVRRIVLDPGHGGKDVGSVTGDGQYEKDITLDIALRLRDLLRTEQGVEVLLTRDHDTQVYLKDRARFANDAKADLFVSIHLNWLVPATNRGIETYVLGATQDPAVVQLTSRENLESGYSLADVRRLLDGIYMDLRQQESQQLAGAIQRSLFSSLREETPALRDRGVRSAPFLVLVSTEMPAVLAEVSCLSNENEAKLLATADYRQGIAEALRSGIRAYTANLTHTVASAPKKAATGSTT
jgi:N-acetylmuramoyl-L-alanine amidase